MIASPQYFSTLACRPPLHSTDVLGELLHSLSQPLTGLRCSLELSLDEVAEHQQERVAAALEQMEKVIGMVQLMREYLDAERAEPGIFSTAFEPAVRCVTEELSSIATIRGVGLSLLGRCKASLPVAEAPLRLALQYLIATIVEAQPVGGRVMLALSEDATAAVLRVENAAASARTNLARPSVTPTLRRVRVAIACRVFEGAGASLVFGDDHAGFVLRIPHSGSGG